MILSLSVLFGLVLALFFLPLQVFLITAIYCYAMLILWRIYSKNVALLDVAVLIIYCSIAALYYLFGFKDIVPFTGSIFYGAIGLASLIGALIGRPFTLMKIQEKPKHEITYHRVMNGLMGISYLVALYLSIALFPASTYIIIPMVISIVSIPGSMFVARGILFIVSMQLELKKRKSPATTDILDRIFGNHDGLTWIEEPYIVKEVTSPEDAERFLSCLKQSYAKVYRSSELRNSQTYDDFFETLKSEYRCYEKHSFSFVVADIESGVPLGTLRTVVSPELPLETCNNLSLEMFRRQGVRTGELGRFGITKEGPTKGLVMKPLVAAMMARLHMEGVELLFTVGTEDTFPLYKKIGFSTYKKPLLDREIRQNAYLCWLNLAALSFSGSLEKQSFDAMRKTQAAQFFLFLYKMRVFRRHLFRKFKIYRNVDVSPLIRETE